MAKLKIFFKALGTKIVNLWKTTAWFKIACIGGAAAIAASVIIPNVVISNNEQLFHECDFSIENVDAKHLYSAANCTEEARYFYSCDCGKEGIKLFRYGDALGHDLIHHEGKNVPCNASGYKEYDTCSRCDYTTYEATPAKDHTDGEWIIDVDATCTEDGSKHQICSVCDATIKTEVIAAKGHTDGEWITDVEATCIEIGSRHQVCSVCDDTINTAIIPITDHTDGEWIIDSAATCTIGGIMHQICSVCSDTIKFDTVPPMGHTDGEWIIDRCATCSVSGIKHQICFVCNDTINIAAIPSIGHKGGEWIIDTEATCTNIGSMHQLCSVCDNTIKVEIISKLEHDRSTLISVEEISGKSYATWTCDLCEQAYTEECSAISATFSTNFHNGTYPQYGFSVFATGGVGTYEYHYAIYDKYSGMILGELNTRSKNITYTDYYKNDLSANNLIVRVYIADDVGEIAFDVPLNDGSFGNKSYSPVYSYRFNGGIFSGVDITT